MKSSGTPSESYSLNASSPDITFPDAAARSRELFEPRQPGSQHGIEPFFFAADDPYNRIVIGVEFRICLAHFGRDDPDEPVKEWLFEAELLAVAHRPPHDLSQHITAPFVGWHDAIADQERHRPQVIRDDAHRNVLRIIDRRSVLQARMVTDGRQNRREHVRCRSSTACPDHRRNPLESHASVD
jgi:hypothetical protein